MMQQASLCMQRVLCNSVRSAECVEERLRCCDASVSSSAAWSERGRDTCRGIERDAWHCVLAALLALCFESLHHHSTCLHLASHPSLHHHHRPTPSSCSAGRRMRWRPVPVTYPRRTAPCWPPPPLHSCARPLSPWTAPPSCRRRVVLWPRCGWHSRCWQSTVQSCRARTGGVLR